MLGVLDADQLARAFFPLGDSTKPQVREEAAARGFSVAKKPDSHDICFIPDGDTRAWLTRRLGERPGELVDAVSGEVVGAHGGAHGFTVGQRRGLGLDRSALDGEPRYVVSVDAPTNRVVIGTADLLGVDLVEGQHLRWCGPAPTGEVRVGAQVRAHGAEVPATATVDPVRMPCGSSSTSGCAASPPGSRSCSTRAPGSSGRRPSAAPAAPERPAADIRKVARAARTQDFGIARSNVLRAIRTCLRARAAQSSSRLVSCVAVRSPPASPVLTTPVGSMSTSEASSARRPGSARPRAARRTAGPDRG